MKDFNEALIVMAVGMITVFLILALVVLIGNLIIRVINKIDKGEEIVKISEKKGFVDNKTMAAIISTVEYITQGQGKIVDVYKNK